MLFLLSCNRRPLWDLYEYQAKFSHTIAKIMTQLCHFFHVDTKKKIMKKSCVVV